MQITNKMNYNDCYYFFLDFFKQFYKDFNDYYKWYHVYSYKGRNSPTEDWIRMENLEHKNINETITTQPKKNNSIIYKEEPKIDNLDSDVSYDDWVPIYYK